MSWKKYCVIGSLAFFCLGAKGGCASTEPVKLYILDVEEQRLVRNRDTNEHIEFSDPRLQCHEIDGERVCEYMCVEIDELQSILPPEL